MTSEEPADRFRILCVCTGNVFRSRIAEHLLREGLRDRLGAAASAFEVTSAGSGVAPVRPVRPSETAALQRVGLPYDDRPSRRLSAADVAGADLVLCADRTHRSAVLELAPGALRRVFLIRELARLAEASPAAAADAAAGDVGVDRAGIDERASLAAQARHVVAAAVAYRAYVGPDASDEISDPWGRPDRVLESAAELVRDAVPRILDRLVGQDHSRRGGELDGQ